MCYPFRSLSKKKIILSFLFPLFTILLLAHPLPMEFGKVPNTDLQMTVYEQDTSAAAIVLCDVAQITVELISGEYKCRLKRHRRLKILKEAGFDGFLIGGAFMESARPEKACASFIDELSTLEKRAYAKQ